MGNYIGVVTAAAGRMQHSDPTTDRERSSVVSESGIAVYSKAKRGSIKSHPKLCCNLSLLVQNPRR